MKAQPKAYSFLVDPGVTFCSRNWGKCGLKMGPLHRPGYAVELFGGRPFGAC